MSLIASAIVFLGGCIVLAGMLVALAIKRASEDVKLRFDTVTVNSYFRGKVDSEKGQPGAERCGAL